MTLLLISHTADLHGAERSLLDFAVGLKTRHLPFLVLCPTEGPLTDELRSGHIPLMIFHLPRPQRDLWHLTWFVFLWLPTVWRLGSFIRRRGITAVYNNTIDGLYAPFAAKLAGIPCLWHVREVKPKSYWGRKLFTWMLRWLPDWVVFNSHDTLLAYAKRPFPHWQIIYNGVVLPTIPTKLTRNIITVGFVGQLVPHKRPDRFLRAFAMAQHARHNLHGIVVGDGPLLEEIKQLTRELNISQQVEVKGYVSSVADLYAYFDLLVLTSDIEPFGRVLVEAMASGCPVVAAQVGGVPEVVEDGRTGFLVQADDISAYAKKITQLAQDAGLRQRMGVAGREHVRLHFTVDQYCEQLIQVLEELCSRNAKPKY